MDQVRYCKSLQYYRARSLAVEHQTHNLTDPSSNLGRPTTIPRIVLIWQNLLQ